MDRIRWGILAPGRIAHKFAEGLKVLPDHELVAVGSRDAGRAEAFAREFGPARHYAGYADLAADPDVDAVYVASPHTGHHAHALLCLEAGKAVLCEKPFAMNEREAREMVQRARAAGLFLMEAMWTRFLPIYDPVRAWLAEGAIGEVRMVRADFSFRAGFDPASRLFARELGGGGLMDVGVYCVSLASMVFGEQPREVAALAEIGPTGVDHQAALALRYGEGRLASLSCGVRTTTDHDARIFGTEGMIHIHPRFWHARAATLERAGAEPEDVFRPYAGNGYECEAAEVGRCLRAGLTESPIMPLEETLGIMRTLDRLRAEMGVTYAEDRR